MPLHRNAPYIKLGPQLPFGVSYLWSLGSRNLHFWNSNALGTVPKIAMSQGLKGSRAVGHHRLKSKGICLEISWVGRASWKYVPGFYPRASVISILKPKACLRDLGTWYRALILPSRLQLITTTRASMYRVSVSDTPNPHKDHKRG